MTISIIDIYKNSFDTVISKRKKPIQIAKVLAELGLDKKGNSSETLSQDHDKILYG